MVTAADIIARLESQLDNVYVDGAAALGATDGELKGTSHIYVTPGSESVVGGEGSSDLYRGEGVMSYVRQPVDVRFGIVMAAQNVRDPRGEAALNDLEILKRDVRQAMIGWQPEGVMLPFHFDGGAISQFAGRTIWWQDIFRTRVLLHNGGAS